MPKSKKPNPAGSFLDYMPDNEREYIKRLAREKVPGYVNHKSAWWKAVEMYYSQWLEGKLPMQERHNEERHTSVTFLIDMSTNFHDNAKQELDNSTHGHTFHLGANGSVAFGATNSGNAAVGRQPWESSTQQDARSRASQSSNATKKSAEATSTQDAKPSASPRALALTDCNESTLLRSVEVRRGGKRGRLTVPSRLAIPGRVWSIIGRKAIERRRAEPGPLEVSFSSSHESPSRKHSRNYSYLKLFHGIQKEVLSAKKAVECGKMNRMQYNQLVERLKVTKFDTARKYLQFGFARFCELLPERCRLRSNFHDNPYVTSKPTKNNPKETVSEIEARLTYIMTHVGHPNPRARDYHFLETAVKVLDNSPSTILAMSFEDCWKLGLTVFEFNQKYFNCERKVLMECLFDKDNSKDWWREAYRLDVELQRVRSENNQLQFGIEYFRSENDQLTHALQGEVDELNKTLAQNDQILNKKDATIAELRRQLLLAQLSRNDTGAFPPETYDPLDLGESTSLEDMSDASSTNEEYF